jgi:serine/threonine-protein kinase
MDNYIGKRLDGRYEITELIGQGGMANVYKAVDVLDNRVVAVKILKREFSESDEFLRRFRNESKAIAVLSHPNIVKIYDMGFSEKLQYIVMEYIDGITLKEYIDSERVLNWKDAVHFIIQILRALQHAHNRGIVHRDIKPQNIMLLTDGTIKVMDFGIAKFAREESMTATDQAIGTVHYISPEQARGDVTDEKSDIYSVGVMFYEMMTGQKPFDTDNPVSIAVMHIKNIPVRPRDINPNIPSGLEEIIMHAMEKDAENRYQTASDMIRDLEAFKQNNQIIFGYYSVPLVQQRVEAGRMQYGTPTQQPYPPYAQAPQSDEYEEESDDEEEYELDDEPDEPETRQKSLVVPILTAVTVVVIVVAAVFIVALLTNPNLLRKSVEVPNLYGMTYEDAVKNYENDIVLSVEEEDYNDEYAAGTIYKQSEDPGTLVDRGDNNKIRIAVAVSKGTQMLSVPEVKGYSEGEAKNMLTDLGFVVEEISEASTEEDGVEKGYCIRTDPAYGTQMKVGSSVYLYVSTGIAVDEVTVPNFVGMTQEDAEVECARANLKIASVEEVDSEKPAGEVVGQSIDADTSVNAGTEITLQISNGSVPEGSVYYGMYLPSDITGKYTIDFTINGQIVESYPFVAESVGGMVEITLTGQGQQTVTVSVTGGTTGTTARIGTYTFDFTAGTFQTVSEDFETAFAAVTPQQTVAATEAQQPVVVTEEAAVVEGVS